jgi:ABC-type nickel/cobalt efflux system permease component RcnA
MHVQMDPTTFWILRVVLFTVGLALVLFSVAGMIWTYRSFTVLYRRWKAERRGKR